MSLKLNLTIIIVVISLLDLYFASKVPFIESNPLAIYFGFWALVAVKLIITFTACYVLWKGKYKTEFNLFNFSATIILIILLWGYGSITGLAGIMQIQQEHAQVIQQANESYVEIRGTPITPTEEQQITQIYQKAKEEQTNQIAIPYYTKIVWIYGIYPYAFALTSFWLFKKLYRTAEIKKRRLIQENVETENKMP